MTTSARIVLNSALLLSLLAVASGHAQLTWPTSRHGASMHNAGACQDGGCLYFSQGCQPGCKSCTDKPSGDTCSEPGGTMKPTLTDIKLRTFMNVSGDDWTAKFGPWRSPGYSPIGSPCGLAGGGDTVHNGNGAHAPAGVVQGSDGRELPEGPKTKWAAGSEQDVAFSIRANHGGTMLTCITTTPSLLIVLWQEATPTAFAPKRAR
jgi:hypothetical protein